MNTEEFAQELDVRGLKCPLPILRTKKALATMASGEVLKVVATDPSTVKDFDAFVRQTGHELLNPGAAFTDEYVFLIRRK